MSTHTATLIFVFITFSQTSAELTLQDRGCGDRTSFDICLLYRFCCYLLCLPIEGWSDWVALDGWLHNEMIYQPADG